MAEIKKMTDSIYLVKGKQDFVMEFSRNGVGGRHSRKQIAGLDDLVTWGTDNNAPLDILDLVNNNNLNPGILEKKTAFLIGSGFDTFKKIKEKGKQRTEIFDYPIFDSFDEACNLQEQFARAATDYNTFGNFFIEFSYNHIGEIVSVKHLDASTVRINKDKTKSFICADWNHNPIVSDDIDLDDWNKVYTRQLWQNNEQYYNTIAVFHGKGYAPGHPFYAPPSWIGARKYIELANRIPEFHASMLKNGINIKYHIEVPSSILSTCKNDDEIDEKKRKIADMISESLSGSENAGKGLTTYYGDGENRLPERWIITPIENKLNDSAYSELFDKINIAILSTHGLPAALAGIQDGAKLGSGSEIRLAYESYLALHTPRPRKVLLEPMNIVKRANKWQSDIVFKFLDTQLTTLDVNPTGSATTITT